MMHISSLIIEYLYYLSLRCADELFMFFDSNFEKSSKLEEKMGH